MSKLGLPVLSVGVTDLHVPLWLHFLAGLGHYHGDCDKTLYDTECQTGTAAFQAKRKLMTDGKVGDQTWGQALTEGLRLNQSFGPGGDASTDRWSRSYPSCPDLRPLNDARKVELFGYIQVTPAPVVGNQEAVRITNDWQNKYLTKGNVPQLAAVPGAMTATHFMHKLMVEPLQKVFADIESEGLLHLVLTFNGLWVPRYVRGSRTNLSNHAWGTAIDLNYQWNQLGQYGALAVEKGSVRDLVPIFNRHGFFWGGHYPNVGITRADPMHFELVSP